jgi:DNA-binding response OmpR family regulator
MAAGVEVRMNDDGTPEAPPDADTSLAPAAANGPNATVRRLVLVVEDSRPTASVVKHFLELEGFRVLVAHDGIRGLEMARLERPDVVVTDVQMPGMDGVAMVQALRADPRTSHIWIMMLTSESSAEGVGRGLAAGPDDYLLKPVEGRGLAARVKALCARSRSGSA